MKSVNLRRNVPAYGVGDESVRIVELIIAAHSRLWKAIRPGDCASLKTAMSRELLESERQLCGGLR